MTDEQELRRQRREAITSFKDLPRGEQVRQLQASGILGPDGHLAPRYRSDSPDSGAEQEKAAASA